MKKYLIIITAIVSILFYSCSGQESYSLNDLDSNFAGNFKQESLEEVTESEITEGDFEPNKNNDIPTRAIKIMDRKLIKEGTIRFETENSKETKKIIQQATNKFNGYFSADNEYSNDYQIHHTISIRVPSENFDKLLANISKSINEIDDQNISVKDVTEEYVDVQARLKAKKVVEKRYLELLSKAYSVGDVLQVENELARLREQIESTEGRLRYLKDQVGLSTLNITFYQTLAYEPNFEFFEKLASGFGNGFIGLLWFFIGLINIWPILLFVGLLVWFVIRLIKKSPKKKN